MSKPIENLSHEGYMDGLRGLDPNPELSAWADSEYNEGWLVGSEDRKAGVVVPKYLGYYNWSELPVKPGMEVTIRKGTMVKTVGREPRPAGKTYKVTVSHLNSGSVAYKIQNFHHSEFVRPTSPTVVWAGPGGYWSEVSISDIPEASEKE
jgi:hypothetical protein